MSTTRPNIVIIMTDQQQAGLCRREGYALDTTPFMDSLAADGVWFSRAYTSMPVCACARTSMLTGRYPSVTRVRTNFNIGDVCAETNMFRYFRQHGYCAALSGKNHSCIKRADTDFWAESDHLGGPGDGATDDDKAFDALLKRTHFHLYAEPTPFPVECQIPHRLVSKAIQWIDTVREQPFFLWLSVPEPHNPFQVCEPYYSLFPPEALPPVRAGAETLPIKGFPYQWCRESYERAFPGFAGNIDRARSNYHGMLRLIDDQVRRFVAHLERTGALENTLIVFLSDHGDFVGEYGLLRKGPELPEVLTRIPLFFHGPSVTRSGQSLAHVSIVDLFPTLCDASGLPIPDGVQGRSLWPLLTGKAYPRDEFRSAFAEHGFGGLPYAGGEPLPPEIDGFKAGTNEEWGNFDCLNSRTQSGVLRMVRKDDWKFTFDIRGRAQLFNLAEDPMELRDLYGNPAFAAKQQEMMSEMLTWLLRVQDPLPLPREWNKRKYAPKMLPHNYWNAQ